MPTSYNLPVAMDDWDGQVSSSDIPQSVVWCKTFEGRMLIFYIGLRIVLTNTRVTHGNNFQKIIIPCRTRQRPAVFSLPKSSYTTSSLHRNRFAIIFETHIDMIIVIVMDRQQVLNLTHAQIHHLEVNEELYFAELRMMCKYSGMTKTLITISSHHGFFKVHIYDYSGAMFLEKPNLVLEFCRRMCSSSASRTFIL